MYYLHVYVQKCLIDPPHRLSIDQVLQHPFMHEASFKGDVDLMVREAWNSPSQIVLATKPILSFSVSRLSARLHTVSVWMRVEVAKVEISPSLLMSILRCFD